MPLSVTKIRKLDPLDALHKFISVDLVITRERNMIAQLLKKYKNPSFNICCPLNVQFISSGVFEIGIDAGRPKREFFNLLINELVRGNFNGMQVFEGETGHLLPINNYELISSHFYKMVGRMILHGALEYLSIQDIPDPCLRERLNEVIINNRVAKEIN